MRRESGVLPVTAAITQAEERPAASRLWAFAKAAGAVIGRKAYKEDVEA